MFFFGGSLDTVSDPLINSIDVDQVGYVEFIGDNDVIAINFDNLEFQAIKTIEIASNNFRVHNRLLYAAVDSSLVRNKSSGESQVHDGINNDNKKSLSDDLVIKQNLNSKALKIKQKQIQANTNELVYPLLC